VIEVRAAQTADAAELVRLRGVMLSGMHGVAPEPGSWQEIGVSTLLRRLAEPECSMAAFVVDRPDNPGRLAACAVGTIDERLGTPDNPSGRSGYLFNVATDPEYRRRGYSRACVSALLDWFRERGVHLFGLAASAAGEPLYRSLGFTRTEMPAMRLHLPHGSPAGR
jgi:GNAT superfamily N-acetyltransferase